MAQHDYDIANQLFPDTRADLNLVLAAIATTNSGAAFPATTFGSMLHYNDTDDNLYIRNKANDAWISLGKITSDKWYPFLDGAQLGQGSTTVKGIWEAADGAESAALASTTLCLTPGGLASVLCTEAALGLTRFATTTEVDAGSATDRALSVLQFARTWKEGTAIATAATIAKPTDANRGGVYALTGSTTVTALWSGAVAGTKVEFRLTGAPQFTNSASLIIPGGTRTFAAGDHLEFTAEGANIWRLTRATLANGKALEETVTIQPKLLQQTYDQLIGPQASSNEIIPHDDTAPTSTEGTQLFSRSFTPQNASSNILIEVEMHFMNASGAGVDGCLALFQGATLLAVAPFEVVSNAGQLATLRFRHAAGSTSARTYSVRYGTSTASVTTVNDTTGGDYGNKIITSMTITEIGP